MNGVIRFAILNIKSKDRALIAEPNVSGAVRYLAQRGADCARSQFGGANDLTTFSRLEHTGFASEKEEAGLGIPICIRRTNGAKPFFYVRACLRSPSMSGGGGGVARLAGFRMHRYSNAATCRSPRLESGRGLITAYGGNTMPSTNTPKQFIGALTVDLLYQTAFKNGRTPRSLEYKAGARMALQHRIERREIEQPYSVGTAAADAYFAGIEEGKAIWRAAAAKIGGPA